MRCLKKTGRALLASVAGVVLAAWAMQDSVGQHHSPAPAAKKSAGASEGQNTAAVDSHGDPLPAHAVQRFGGLRFRVSCDLGAPALAPDGKHFATVEGDICIRDRATGKLQKRLPGDKIAADYLCYSPDGRRVVASSWEDKVFVWNVETGKKEIEANGIVPVFSKDGKVLYTGGERSSGTLRNIDICYIINQDPIRCWDLVTKKELPSFGKGVPLAVSPNRKRLASISGKVVWEDSSRVEKYENLILSIWDATTGKELAAVPLESGGFVGAVFSEKGLYYCLYANSAKQEKSPIWFWPNGDKAPRRVPWNYKQSSFRSFSPNGEYFAARKGNSIFVWDLHAGKKVQQITLGSDSARWRNLTFSPSGKELAVCVNSRVLRFWDVATGKEISPTTGHLGDVASAALSPDGRWVASASYDHSLRLWDRKTGKERRRFDHPGKRRFEFSDVLFTPSGKLIASDGYKLWICDSEQWDREPQVRDLNPAGPEGVWRLTLSPDGRCVTGCTWNGSYLGLWEIASGKQLWRSTKSYCGQDLAFSPDGKLLVSAGQTKNLQPSGVLSFWDPATGKQLDRFAGADVPISNLSNAHRLAFSPDGNTLAYAHLRDVHGWEMVTETKRFHFKVPRFVTAAAFSPKSRNLAIGLGGNIELWDTATGKMACRFAGHRGEIRTLSFSADGTELVSASGDTTIIVWRVPDLRTQKQNLSRKEFERLWSDLAGNDAARAYRAAGQLADSFGTAEFLANFFRQRKKPAAAKVTRWIKDLGSNDFKTREKAKHELEAAVDLIEADLRQALKKPGSLEAHLRIKKLLNRLDPPSGKLLQMLRAVEVLEWNEVPEARAALRQLTHGAAGPRIATAAEAALRRLE